ncbi:hypothetical protein L484_021650 [Morus notabilis]|uniref:Uncharacterized protein n=1 Tax=Morus notabilis TaxID=981085 RepID=W9S6Q5_9ROSA|nr:hypothetical protein L484_021650 [Morus notabilis]
MPLHGISKRTAISNPDCSRFRVPKAMTSPSVSSPLTFVTTVLTFIKIVEKLDRDFLEEVYASSFHPGFVGSVFFVGIEICCIIV